jgi:hypothetical protein
MRALVLLTLVFGCGVLGCGAGSGSSGQPGPSSAGGENPAAGHFSLATQHVGEPSDGLVLRSIRHAPHETYHRIVFDLALAEGVPASAIPHATARYREHDKSIELTIAGVRHDLSGNLPLRREDGAAFGRPVPVDRPPVSYFARELVLDDSAVAYRVQLTRRARWRLIGLTQPVRIVLDVENTGGAR